MPGITRTSYRDVALLALCQALLLVNNAALIAMNGLVGQQLAADKSFATLGASTFVLGSALSTMPASLWMRRVGRRRGFITGSSMAVVGSAIASLGLFIDAFWLYCVGTAVIGVYTAFGIQYRFAAAEVACPADRAKAISWVLAGGIAGGFLGPETARLGKDLFVTPFLGSFVAMSAIAVVAMGVQSRVRIPMPSAEESRSGGRRLRAVARQPAFVVAVLASALGYGVMNLLMTATPLAMSFCDYPFAAAAMVIEWHVVGMYAPGLFTGHLINRFGVVAVIVAGVLLMVLGVSVSLAGTSIGHFGIALALIGVGWNFMFTGGTTLVTEAYAPVEKAKTQGLKDFCVFATMTVSSFASGALVNAAGWERMNWAALPFLAIVALSSLWLLAGRRRARAASSRSPTSART